MRLRNALVVVLSYEELFLLADRVFSFSFFFFDE